MTQPIPDAKLFRLELTQSEMHILVGSLRYRLNDIPEFIDGLPYQPYSIRATLLNQLERSEAT